MSRRQEIITLMAEIETFKIYKEAMRQRACSLKKIKKDKPLYKPETREIQITQSEMKRDT